MNTIDKFVVLSGVLIALILGVEILTWGQPIDNIETPAVPTEVQPAPPYYCDNGEVAACSIVNDWWCDPEVACLGEVTVSAAEVYAPVRLSPLGILQSWRDHYSACRAHSMELEHYIAMLELALEGGGE